MPTDFVGIIKMLKFVLSNTKLKLMKERSLAASKLHEQIKVDTLAKRRIVLNPLQEMKFDTACWKVIDDHPHATKEIYLTASNIYLNFILDYPDLTL